VPSVQDKLKPCKPAKRHRSRLSKSQVCFFFCFPRTLVFPVLIRGGKPTLLFTFVLAFLFCTLNGYLQSRYLSQFAVYAEDWVTHPCFLTGECTQVSPFLSPAPQASVRKPTLEREPQVYKKRSCFSRSLSQMLFLMYFFRISYMCIVLHFF
jgi:hypothetical protein